MDAKKLAVLLEAVHIGSLKKAADQLNYTQSGLIYTINAVEKDIGMTVLNRSHKGISLNETGKELEPYFRALVEADVALEERTAQLYRANKAVEKVRVVTYPSLVRFLLPALIHEFSEIHPTVEFEIVTGVDEVPRLLTEGKVDFAIAERRWAGENEWFHVLNTELYAAVPGSFPIASFDRVLLDDIVEYPLIIPTYNTARELRERLSTYKHIKKIKVSTPDSTVLLSMVEQKMGITFLSKLNAGDCPEDVRLIPIEPPIIREMGIIVRGKTGLKAITKEFITFIYEKMSTMRNVI